MVIAMMLARKGDSAVLPWYVHSNHTTMLESWCAAYIIGPFLTVPFDPARPARPPLLLTDQMTAATAQMLSYWMRRAAARKMALPNKSTWRAMWCT